MSQASQIGAKKENKTEDMEYSLERGRGIMQNKLGFFFSFL